MHVNVADARLQTIVFTLLLVLAFILTAKKDSGPHEMNVSHTNELKGIAILTVIFGHIGYILFWDHKFLYPLSVASGAGVNIFLFLSGFGLTSSALASKKSVFQFYFKRLRNIFIPLWVVLTPLFLLDAYLLNRTYSATSIIHSFLGFFPSADVDSAVNSPLWYFTLILFYYLIFPLVFWNKKPLLSIAVVFLLGYYTVNLKLPVVADTLKFYQLHYLAFPFGMLFAYLNRKNFGVTLNNYLVKITHSRSTLFALRYLLVALLLVVFGYVSIHSGVGESLKIEQKMSLIMTGLLVLFFLIKDVQSKLLVTLGTYSYEIYLIHWPLMYRYDFIYKYTPAFLGTALYILVFLILGVLLNRVVKFILKIKF